MKYQVYVSSNQRFQRLFMSLEARVQSQMPWFSKKMFAIAYNDLKRSRNTDSNEENGYYSISHEAYFAKVIYVSWTWNNFSGNKRQPRRSRCTLNYFKWILKYNKTFFFLLAKQRYIKNINYFIPVRIVRVLWRKEFLSLKSVKG